MATSKSVNILTAQALLQQRTNFQHKFWNSFNASRKAAHIAITTVQDQYDKRLKTLQDEHIKKAQAIMGKPDRVADPDIIKNVCTFSKFSHRDDNGEAIYREDLCHLKLHEALCLLRNPNHLNEPLTHLQQLYCAEKGLSEDCKAPTVDDIDKAEFELLALDDLLDQLKNSKFNEKLQPYNPDMPDEAALNGEKTYKVHGHNHNARKYEDGMNQEEINRHAAAYGRSSGVKPMTRRKAEQIMRDSTRDLNGKAGSQDLNKPPMSPEDMALHIYRQNGVVPDGYQVQNDSKGQRLVKL